MERKDKITGYLNNVTVSSVAPIAKHLEHQNVWSKSSGAVRRDTDNHIWHGKPSCDMP